MKTLLRLRLIAGSVREHLFGIECNRCGVTARLPAPTGWGWGTVWDGRAAWTCGECRVGDVEVLR